MNLLEIRQHVIKKSGRYDLATGSDLSTDAGIDYYINAAIQTLDLEQEQGEMFREASWMQIVSGLPLRAAGKFPEYAIWLNAKRSNSRRNALATW